MATIGSFCTSVLRTTDPDRAVAFYGSLIGWTAHSIAADHTFLKHDGKTVASIQRIDTGSDEWVPHLLVDPGWDLRPVWLTFISVDDCDATMAHACDVGGESGFVHTVPKHGRIGMIGDPGGAVLWLRGPVPAAQT